MIIIMYVFNIYERRNLKKLIKVLGKFLLGCILSLFLLLGVGLLVNIAYEDDIILFLASSIFLIAYCIGIILLLVKKDSKHKYIFFWTGFMGIIISFICDSELHPLTDEELCSDTGICYENVISKEECAKLEGTWKKGENEWFCRLKWADVEE